MAASQKLNVDNLHSVFSHHKAIPGNIETSFL